MNDANGANTHQEPTGAAGDPAVAGAPVSGAPEKRRSALRPWLWLPVAGFAVLSITGAVVGGFLVGGSVVDGVNAGRAGVLAVPTEAATDVAEPTDAPTPASTSGADLAGQEGTVSLDDQVDLGGTFPAWGYPILDGWGVTVFDEQGINQSENSELGCQLTSSQNVQSAYDAGATDDLTDTLATVDALEQQLLSAGNDATLVGELGFTDFGINLPGAAERIEFLTTRIDYVDPEAGVSYTNEIAARAMPLSESFMYIVVRCPTSLVDAGGSPFEELRAGLAVIIDGPGKVGPE
ncbi:hypothetical protein [Cryobacterium zongtaii]|uniref:hypothetical protein n=1 Tax=Cryobacterium zongtaii TaxID=1259217 RepID=UPI000CD43238|nr:hypothetical protein [Cryobacterium zongtaii]